ncbi:MAG: hypothetical protein ABSE92_14285 [Terriglobales bacterium]|jgi:methyl-accepting chemotaxis protein
MNYLPIFVAVTSVAIVIQTGILIGMFLALRKTAEKLDTVTSHVNATILPAVDLTREMLVELRPKIENIATNLSETTTIIRTQVERVDATLTELVDRARLQVIRTDELVGRAIDKVEDATESVQKTVSIPVKQLSGIMRGVSAGLDYLATQKRRQATQRDEMFI